MTTMTEQDKKLTESLFMLFDASWSNSRIREIWGVDKTDTFLNQLRQIQKNIIYTKEGAS